MSSAGHVHFVLRDNAGQIRCVLFATQAANVALTPRAGMRLIAHGYVDVFLKGGSYNLRCDDLLPAGAGDAFLRLEALRKRLEAEGLFKHEAERFRASRQEVTHGGGSVRLPGLWPGRDQGQST